MPARTAAVLACALLTGCGASLTVPPLATGSNITPPPPPQDAPQANTATGALTPSGSTPTVDGTTIAVYDLIAKGALTCWFGPGAPLKATHIFHADVPSPTEKRDVAITVHERDTSAQAANPRGTRAFRIALSAEAEARTRVTMQIGKLPADLAAAMEKDVVTWAHGRQGCQSQVVRPPPPPPPPPPPKKKAAKKKA